MVLDWRLPLITSVAHRGKDGILCRNALYSIPPHLPLLRKRLVSDRCMPIKAGKRPTISFPGCTGLPTVSNWLASRTMYPKSWQGFCGSNYQKRAGQYGNWKRMSLINSIFEKVGFEFCDGIDACSDMESRLKR